MRDMVRRSHSPVPYRSLQRNLLAFTFTEASGLKLWTHRASASSGSGKVPLECIVTLHLTLLIGPRSILERQGERHLYTMDLMRSNLTLPLTLPLLLGLVTPLKSLIRRKNSGLRLHDQSVAYSSTLKLNMEKWCSVLVVISGTNILLYFLWQQFWCLVLMKLIVK